MPEEFDGLVVIGGLLFGGEPGRLRVDGVPMIGKGKLPGPIDDGIVNTPGKGEIECGHIRVNGTGKGEPAANFNSHVGIEGNLDVSGGNINVLTGDLVVRKGDIQLVGADCAEDFEVLDDTDAPPGSVMVLRPDGKLVPSSRPYDRRAVGIVSGAGCYRPGLTLDKGNLGTDGDTRDAANRVPIGLIGKLYCRVEATSERIAVGDLLTTSEVVGHAMKATDSARAFGAIIGKALAPLPGGRGLIPVLACLQ